MKGEGKKEEKKVGIDKRPILPLPKLLPLYLIANKISINFDSGCTRSANYCLYA